MLEKFVLVKFGWFIQEEILNRYDVFVGSQVRLILPNYIIISDQHTLTSV